MQRPQFAEALLASDDSGASQHLRRHAEFTPRCVLDTLAPTVTRRMIDKSGLDRCHIGFDLQRFGCSLNVATFLHQQQAFDGLGISDLCVDSAPLCRQRLGGLFATRTGAVGFEGLEIVADRRGLDATNCNSRFVFICHCSFCHGACIADPQPVSMFRG